MNIALGLFKLKSDLSCIRVWSETMGVWDVAVCAVTLLDALKSLHRFSGD
jgi:hypothetical protein